MRGCITSHVSGVNKYGVPYTKVLELEREAHERHARALMEALQRWVDADRARRANAKREAEQLQQEALQLTEKALG